MIARHLIEQECLRTVLDFFAALDARADAEVIATFSPNGIWERNGERLQGREAIAASLMTRDPRRTTCHVVSNVRFELHDGVHACANFYLLAYEGFGATTEDETRLRLAAIRSCTDSFSHQEDRWLIDLKRSRLHLPSV